MRDGGRYLRPWIVGGVIWTVLSLAVLLEYARQTDAEHLAEIWFLLSLLWAEFGFAGIFHCLRSGRRHRLGNMLLVALVPPLILYLLISGG